jgi:hypothetical protein
MRVKYEGTQDDGAKREALPRSLILRCAVSKANRASKDEGEGAKQGDD